MIKADIIDLVHEKIGFSRHESAEVVEAALDVLMKHCRRGSGCRSSVSGAFSYAPRRSASGAIPKPGKRSPSLLGK
jgi:integration host factor subunit alpha